MKNGFLLVLLLLVSVCLFGQAVGFSVQGTYRQGVAKDLLQTSKTLKDINSGYPSSWISGYSSVEIKATYINGLSKSALGKDDLLTQDQIALIKSADYGTDLAFMVKYQEEADEPKEVNFTYTVIPEQEADYLGGQEALRAYIKDHAITKIPTDLYKNEELTVISFKIGLTGSVEEAHIIHASPHTDIDNLLLNVVKNMPDWKAAKNAEGESIIQEFVLNVGFMAAC